MKKILVVEDDPDLSCLIGEILEDHLDVKVTLATSGAQALEALKIGGYDAMTLDHHLGDMRGTTMLLKARFLQYSIPPLILVTGNPVAVGEWLSEQSKAHAVLMKPFVTEELLGCLVDLGCSKKA